MKEKHKNFQLTTSDLRILYNKPYLGASPDSIVSCSCHTVGLLEIKCPFNYRNDLVNWETDKNFSIDSFENMKKNLKYKAQVQVRVTRDLKFNDEMMPLLWKLFIECLPPEVVTYKNDVCLDNEQKYYCIYKRPCFEPMIACDKPGCKVEWFHYSCVKSTQAPVGSWICNSCMK
ncbi:inhibitor of growth protein 4-like [Hydra vulgaris]|uniref:Inhibitor of growth protein 4-like n=1 Tax=Hydra vulgaris TaxID=6087 RepID=A0ABM4CUM3_HYDVU